MSVYVDPIFEAKGPHGFTEWCHMFADSLEELHAMADKIGMRREWFQNKRHPHYDLRPETRELAVSLGAIELKSTKQFLRWVQTETLLNK